MEINVVLQKGFERWLNTIGYAEATVYASTNYVRDFFFYLKKTEIRTIEDVDQAILNSYHKHLQIRRNKRQTGGLSPNYINSNINAIKRLSKYLQETGKPFFEVPIKTSPETENAKTILTQAEIQKLYKACGNDILGIRDRAMLGIYYGCGLRRSEGLSLNLNDVLLKDKLVHVSKGKHYKERYVPMTESIKEDLENYIYVAREKVQSFKPQQKQTALFLSMRAKRMHGNSIILRLQKLAELANVDKEIGLHTLRHSIATHLLQSGMELEEVSHFLGHSGLESTQIYTHLAHEI
jgi:integrase/recombinase XerD